MICKLFVFAVVLVAFVCASPEPGLAYSGLGARSFGYGSLGYGAPALAYGGYSGYSGYGGYGAAAYGRGYGLPYGRAIYG